MKKSHIMIISLLVMMISSCAKFEVGIVAPTATEAPDEKVQHTEETTAVPPTNTPTPQPDIPSTLSPTDEVSPQSVSTQYWAVHQDPGLGFRFVLPCFWRVEFPDDDRYNLEDGVYYHAFNYTQDYPFSFPRNQIPPENGAVNVTFDIININAYDLPPGSSLREYVIQENSSPESEILEIVDEVINGQPAISVIVQNQDSNSISRYYLIKINDDFFLRFSTQPSSKLLNTPDVESILNSITIDPGIDVPLPTHTPAPPPIGLPAPCIPDYTEAVALTLGIPEENTDCGVDSFKSLDFLTQAVQQNLQDRNTGGLRWDFLIHDPFMIDYWGSGGSIKNPDEVATELANSLYNPAQPGSMTFTTDPGEFPPFVESSPLDLMHPGSNLVHVIYSEGWGLDGQGAALLFFTQDECNGYYWFGLIFSEKHFDK